MNDWIRRHQLPVYFGVAYFISWSVAVPLVLQAQGLLDANLPWALHYLTAFGPAAAALLVTRVAGDTHRGRWFEAPSRRSLLWWTVGFGSPLLMFVVAQIAALAAGRAAPSWTGLGQVNFLPELGLAAWVLWFATSGCGEELGWRGFALPRLQRAHSAAASSVILAIGWAVWHLPAFFYLPSYATMGLNVLPGFFLGILAGSIVLTWLYNNSRGSVMAVVLWHASFNFVTASPSAAGVAAAMTSSMVMVWAVVILWRCDWTTFGVPAARLQPGLRVQ